MQLSSCLLSYFAGFCPELIQYIMRQFDFQDLPSNEHSLSLVKLVLQVFNREQCVKYVVLWYSKNTQNVIQERTGLRHYNVC